MTAFSWISKCPKLHGFQLAKKIRASNWNKTTPIVIVTGRDERDTMREAFATGATFYLQKPVDRQKLNGLFRSVRGTLSENRRRSIRVPMQTEVNCSVGARAIQGQTWNLSQSGMQLEVGSVAPGDIIRVSFRLPASSNVIDAVGTVVWAREDRQGIQFTKITNKHRDEISQFIDQVENS